MSGDDVHPSVELLEGHAARCTNQFCELKGLLEQINLTLKGMNILRRLDELEYRLDQVERSGGDRRKLIEGLADLIREYHADVAYWTTRESGEHAALVGDTRVEIK